MVTNGYRGANIDKLIAPIQQARYETFEQIVEHNFTVHAEFSSKYYMNYDDFKMYYAFDESDPGISKQVKTSFRDNYREYRQSEIGYDGEVRGNVVFMNMLKMEKRLYLKVLRKVEPVKENSHVWNSSISNSFQNIVDFIHFHVKLPVTFGDIIDSTNSTVVVEKLAKCNNEAFLGSFEGVRKVASKLKKHLRRTHGDTFNHEQVSISVEPIMTAYKIKVFFNIPVNLRESFTGRLLKLSESGLENLWENWA